MYLLHTELLSTAEERFLKHTHDHVDFIDNWRLTEVNYPSVLAIDTPITSPSSRQALASPILDMTSVFSLNPMKKCFMGLWYFKS